MKLKMKYLILITWLLLVLLRLLKIKNVVLVIQSKKTDYNTTINDIEKKITDHNHDEYITTPEFNKLTAENFAAILKQVNLASKSDFVNKTDFDNQVKNVTSNKNELNELAKKVKAISTKGLTKSFTGKFSVINGAKYFFKKYFKAIQYLYQL